MSYDFFSTFSEEERKVMEKVVKQIWVLRISNQEKGKQVPKGLNGGKNKRGHRELKGLELGMRYVVKDRRGVGQGYS